MSNLVSRTRTVHAIAGGGPFLTVPLCGTRVAMLNGTTGHHSVTCGNCQRAVGREHAEALELHREFLVGVAQAEVMAELLGRPEGLDKMSDTMLSDEILWARSELFADPRHLTAYARRLTNLKLEREWRQADAELASR